MTQILVSSDKATGKDFNIYEVKSTQTILPKLFKGMDFFDNIISRKVSKRTLIYSGSENQDRTKYRVRTWNNVEN